MTICLEHRGSLSGAMIGEYRLDSLLGKGGMAEVYRAHDTLLKRDVALKMLHEHLSANPEYIARFRGEARRVAALSHPHIVPIYRFGEEHGLCYLVMPVLHWLVGFSPEQKRTNGTDEGATYWDPSSFRIGLRPRDWSDSS